jgi:hypothetical protein
LALFFFLTLPYFPCYPFLFMIGKCSLKMFFMCVCMYYIGVLKNIHLADFWKPILLFIAQLSAFLSSQSPHTTLLNQQARQITHKLYKHFTLLTSFGRAARTLLFRLYTRHTLFPLSNTYFQIGLCHERRSKLAILVSYMVIIVANVGRQCVLFLHH